MWNRMCVKILYASLAVGLACSVSGCVGLVVLGAQQLTMPSEDENAQLERSIVNGATTKAELIERLGLPIHELNDGRVLVFGGRNRPRGLLHLATEDKRDEHRLIAVIDETEILRDHLWVGKRTEARKLANAGAIAR